MGIKVIAKNKRASYDYFLDEKYEAGLCLVGTEVKSLREGKVSIAEAYVNIDARGEVWVYNMNIAHFKFGNQFNHEEARKRKLLLNQKEIAMIYHKMKAGSMTIVPTHIYFKGGRIKLGIALARGKKQHDKRQDQAKKDIDRKLRQRDYS